MLSINQHVRMNQCESIGQINYFYLISCIQYNTSEKSTDVESRNRRIKTSVMSLLEATFKASRKHRRNLLAVIKLDRVFSLIIIFNWCLVSIISREHFRNPHLTAVVNLHKLFQSNVINEFQGKQLRKKKVEKQNI